jgi:photosystem II stability/assembly factor-like uncharacterized protein
MKKIFLGCLLIIATASCHKKSSPTACFSASRTSAAVTQSISFTSNCTIDGSGFSWDFGDGTTSSSANPTHAYSSAGNYNVTLNVSNSGGSNKTSQTITITNAEWKTVLTGSGYYLNSVFFTDTLTGYAVGASSTTSGILCLFKTNDGGKTWTINTSYGGLGVYFANASTGYIVGMSGVIYKTIDAGVTWAIQPSGTISHLQAACFVDANTGFAVGSNGTIIGTTNGGNSWSVLPSGVPTGVTLYSIYFLNSMTGYAAGNNGTIVETTDRGVSWTTLPSGSTSDLLSSVWFTSPTRGYAIGAAGYNGTLETTDGGLTWSPIPGFVGAVADAICFTNPSSGYAVGLSVLGGNASALQTTDGGATWKTIGTSTDLNLHDICFPSSTTGFAVGYTGGNYVIVKYSK